MENIEKEISSNTVGSRVPRDRMRGLFPGGVRGAHALPIVLALAQKNDGSYVIVEVKGENMIDDAVVKAKARSAAQLAAANAMTYQMIPSMKVTFGLHPPTTLAQVN